MNESIRMSLTVSPELNQRLDQLAADGGVTKSDILRKAIALYDLAAEAKAEKKHIGILDRDKRLETEIVGI